MNKQVAVYDNTVSARTYLSYISEQAGGFACIGRDGKLYIKTIGQYTTELPLKYFSTFKWGEKFILSRIKYEDGVQLFERGDETSNTLYISQDNMYIVDQEQIDNIFNKLNGLELYSFEGDSIIDPALDIGDILIVDDKKVIYQGSSEYCGKFKASISSKIQCKAKEETTIRIPSQKTINRRVQSRINQQDGTITQLAEQTSENSKQVVQVTQKAEDLNIQAQNIQTEVKELENGLTEVNEKVKGLNFNFSTQGLNVAGTEDANNSTLDNKGLKVRNYNNLQAIFNYKGSGIEKLIVTGNAQIGYLRFVKSTKDNQKVTKIFHLDQLIEKLEDLEV